MRISTERLRWKLRKKNWKRRLVDGFPSFSGFTCLISGIPTKSYYKLNLPTVGRMFFWGYCKVYRYNLHFLPLLSCTLLHLHLYIHIYIYFYGKLYHKLFLQFIPKVITQSYTQIIPKLYPKSYPS